MKLFGSYTSPFVRHCRLVLLETHLTCEFIETDTSASAAQSPTQRVPFLQDKNAQGDTIFLTDSLSIVKYLREKAGQVFCRDARELDKFCLVSTLMDATVNLFFIKRDGVDINAIPYLQRQAARIDTTLAELNQLPLPSCAPYNDAELRLACFIGWAKLRAQVDFSRFNKLETFYTNCLNYPAFAQTKPPQT
jgi:glutathione S-transferase